MGHIGAATERFFKRFSAQLSGDARRPAAAVLHGTLSEAYQTGESSEFIWQSLQIEHLQP